MLGTYALRSDVFYRVLVYSTDLWVSTVGSQLTF